MPPYPRPKSCQVCGDLLTCQLRDLRECLYRQQRVEEYRLLDLLEKAIDAKKTEWHNRGTSANEAMAYVKHTIEEMRADLRLTVDRARREGWLK